MKQNIENKVNENNAEMQEYINKNINMVPKNQRRRFEAMTLEQKVTKIKFYIDILKLREDARIKNSIINRTKELFEKRHATINDATEVLNFCKEFIDGFKQREVERIDAEIARLEEMKNSIVA